MAFPLSGGTFSAMGDIFSRVELLGLDAEGDPQGHAVARAIVDTGASISIISRKLARELRGVSLPALAVIEGKMRRGAMVAMRPARAGCKLVAVAVVVDDELVARAGEGAAMIFGHDYMQKQRVAVYMHEDLARRGIACGSRGPRKAAASTGRAAQ